MSATDVLWNPPADWRTSTLIGELCQRLGAASYEELLETSLHSPQDYWQAVMDHLEFRWRVAPSEFVDLTAGAAFPKWFPGGQLNCIDTVLAHATGPHAARPAVISESENGQVDVLSYSELGRDVLEIAAGLQRIGIRPGDRVGLMMVMGGAAVTAVLALAAIGAIAVPLFTGFGAEAAATRLRLAGARAIIATSSFERRGRRVDLAPVLCDIHERLPNLLLVAHGSLSGCPARTLAWTGMRGELLANVPAFRPGQPFMIVFTSGTTGAPKGTVHTHAGFPLKILHDCAYHFELRPGDRWLWPSDMGWIVGPITTLGALSRGAALVCYDGAPDHPDAGRLAQMIDRHRVTHFGASPTLIRSLAASRIATGTAILDSLRVLMVAGEVIDREHFEWFFQSFGRGSLPVINYSGGTEVSGGLVANVLARPIRACAFNTVSPGIDVFAADEEGLRVRGRPGELVIAEPFIGMTDGFWQARDRYLETYWSQRPTLWSHGDLLLEGVDGQFFILGRSDDTLKIAGKRVGPAEVEAVVLEFSFVRDVAAIALPHEVKGEQLVICASTQEAAPPDLAERIAARIEAALGKPFRPAHVHLVPALPRTRNGKVMRRLVRNILRGLPTGDTSALENPEAVTELVSLLEKQ